MSFPSANLMRVLALTATVTVASACSERHTAERADSDLSHDLALAGQVNAQPALQDTAAATEPQPKAQEPLAPAPRADRTSPRQAPVPRAANVAQAPVKPAFAESTVVRQPDSSALAAAAPAPVPEPMVIDSGTGIALSSGMRVCTNTN